jgi:hypothetical protein
MARQEIIEEIRRIAAENGGRAPGQLAFTSVTGVKRMEWYPGFWLRWSDALSDAGHAPNGFQAKTSDQTVIEKYASFIRELGRLPVSGEIKRRAKADPSFPAHTVFSRLGGKDLLIRAVAAHCRRIGGFDDILALCAERETQIAPPTASKASREPKIRTEFVYLMKSGPHYKIGRTNSVARKGQRTGHQNSGSP